MDEREIFFSPDPYSIPPATLRRWFPWYQSVDKLVDSIYRKYNRVDLTPDLQFQVYRTGKKITQEELIRSLDQYSAMALDLLLQELKMVNSPQFDPLIRKISKILNEVMGTTMIDD